jgi:hypothetical protein
MTTMTAATMTLCLVFLAPADGSMSRGGAEDQQTQATPKRQPATRRAQPTAAERAQMTKLIERQREWVKRTAAELTVTINSEREQFRRQRAAELEARNEKTRAEIARHLQAVRGDSRRLEIQLEAAELLRRSRTASGADRVQIDRRAAQLMAELERLKR